jgi:hypothetical protein
MTPLDKTLKRALKIKGRTYVVALSPEGLKLTLKGKRRGQELRWTDLISGDAALAVALNASLGEFARSGPAPPSSAPFPASAPRPAPASAPRPASTPARKKTPKTRKKPRRSR